MTHRTAVWEKMYRPFLDERERKRKKLSSEGHGRSSEEAGGRERGRGGGKRGRKPGRSSDAGVPQATSRASKRINYDALQVMFQLRCALRHP